MTKSELENMIKSGPCKIVMASGRVWIIDHSEFTLVDKRTIAVLHKEDNGKRKLRIIAMNLIETAEVLEDAA